MGWWQERMHSGDMGQTSPGAQRGCPQLGGTVLKSCLMKQSQMLGELEVQRNQADVLVNCLCVIPTKRQA